MLLSANQTYMDAVVSKAMIGTACDLIMDAYKMDVPAMKSPCIPTLDDAISKQKWAVDVKIVKKMLEFEKDMQNINGDDLKWLQPSSCDTVLEDMTLPLPLRDSLYAFPSNACKDLLVLQPLPNVSPQTGDSLGELICRQKMNYAPRIAAVIRDLFDKLNGPSVVDNLCLKEANSVLLRNDYDPYDEDDILDPFSLLSICSEQHHISNHMYKKRNVKSGNAMDKIVHFRSTAMLKDQAFSDMREKYGEHKKPKAPLKSIRHINASNNNSTSVNAHRIGVRDDASSFASALNHLEYSTSQQHDDDYHNYHNEFTVSSMSRLTNTESSTRQVPKHNHALPSIHQWSSLIVSENDPKSLHQETAPSGLYSTMRNMAVSMTSLPSRTVSSAFPSNQRSPCYGDGSVRSTICSTSEVDQLQNIPRKRSIMESMNDSKDSVSSLKNNRRKLSLVSPNLSRFSRPSDASDTCPEFSIPLSACYNSYDYEGIGINAADFSITNDRPKDVLHKPPLQQLHVETNSFKVADRVNEFVRLRKKTTPFFKQ